MYNPKGVKHYSYKAPSYSEIARERIDGIIRQSGIERAQEFCSNSYRCWVIRNRMAKRVYRVAQKTKQNI